MALEPLRGTTGSVGKVPLRVVGVPLRESRTVSPPVPGEDFPRGIEFLDVQWFVDRIGLDTLSMAANDEKLRELRTRAAFIVELAALKDLALRKQRGVS